MATAPGTMKETHACTPEGFFGPSDHDRNHDDADRNAPTVGRRRKTVDTGIDGHPARRPAPAHLAGMARSGGRNDRHPRSPALA